MTPVFPGSYAAQQQQRANTPEFKALLAQQDAISEQLQSVAQQTPLDGQQSSRDQSVRNSPLFPQALALDKKMRDYMNGGQPQPQIAPAAIMPGEPRLPQDMPEQTLGVPQALPQDVTVAKESPQINQQLPQQQQIIDRLQQATQMFQNQQATQMFQNQQATQLPPMLSGSSGGLGSLGGGGGGQQSLNLGQVGLTFKPSGEGGGQDKGYTGWSFAEGGNVNNPGIAGLNAGNMGFMNAGDKSKKEELREIDILNSYFRQANILPQQSLKMLKQVIQSGVTFKRAGNTMMGSKPLPPNASQVYFFTIDQPDGFAVAVKQLLGGLKQAGVQTVYLNKIDPTIVQAMQAAGAAPQQSDRPEYKIMAAI
jgi:hypothetical protein